MRKIRIFLFLLIVLLSCQSQEKIDKVKWQVKEDPAFPPQSRKAMITDLQSNYKLEGISRFQIVELLGEPDFSDDSSIAYKIEEKFGRDIEPIYTKTLELKFTNHKTVQAIDVREWTK